MSIYKQKYIKYKIQINNLSGGGNNLLNFPFKWMKKKYSNMDVQWVINDKDNGEKMPMDNLTKLYKNIKKIYYYKEGWNGLDRSLSYYETLNIWDAMEEPYILQQLKNNVYIYIYSTTDSSGYDCITPNSLKNGTLYT